MKEAIINEIWKEQSVTVVEYTKKDYLNWLNGKEPTITNFEEFLYECQEYFDTDFTDGEVTESEIVNLDKLFEDIINED